MGLPAVPDVSTEMNSTSSTSSLRGSPKLQPSISGSPSPIRRATDKNVTNSTERPSFLSMDKEIPSAEDPTSKGEHENDNTVSKNSVELGLPPLFNPKPAGSSGLYYHFHALPYLLDL